MDLLLWLDVGAEMGVAVADHVAGRPVLAHEHVAGEGVAASAVDGGAAEGGGVLPDELGEVAGLGAEAGRGAEVVVRSFVAPGVDGGGRVGVAEREVFSCGPA